MTDFNNFYFGRYFISSSVQISISRSEYSRITDLKHISFNNVRFLISPLFSMPPRSFNSVQNFPARTFSFYYPSSGIALPIFYFYDNSCYHFSWHVLLLTQNMSFGHKGNSLAPSLKLVALFLICLKLKLCFAYPYLKI